MTVCFILGSNGMLGTYVKTYFERQKFIQIMCIDKTILDATKPDKLDELDWLIRRHNPSYIINCIGLIRQRTDSTSKDMFLVNSVFPQVLFTFLKYSHPTIQLVHISTDCVYTHNENCIDETREHQLLEDKNDVYGTSKSCGENANMMIIRTSIIGEETQNKRSLIEFVKNAQEETLYGYTDHRWNGITCLELTKFLYHIVQNELHWSGVRHVFSPDIVSKFDLICLINEVWDCKKNIKPIEKGVKYLCLTTRYPNLVWTPPTIKQQLQECYDFGIQERK